MLCVTNAINQLLPSICPNVPSIWKIYPSESKEQSVQNIADYSLSVFSTCKTAAIESFKWCHIKASLGFIKIASLIKEIAILKFAEIAVTLYLFYLFHNVFFMGLVVGALCKEKMKEMIEVVENISDTYFDPAYVPFHQRAMYGLGFFGFILFTMPSSILGASFYQAAVTGYAFRKKCEEIIEQRKCLKSGH